MRHATTAPTGSIGAVHQPAEDYAATAVRPANLPATVPTVTTAAYPAAVAQPTDQYDPPTGQPVVIVQAAPPVATPAAGSTDGTGAVMSKLLLGAGIGVGAVIAFAIAGPLLLATIQALATTMIAVGACAVALAVAAAMVMKSFRGPSSTSTVPARKGRR